VSPEANDFGHVSPKQIISANQGTGKWTAVNFIQASSGLYKLDFCQLLVFHASFFGCLIDLTGYGSLLIHIKIEELVEGVVPHLRENEGVTHARLAGRDGGVAGRYTNMWLGETPGKLPNFRCFGKHARGSRI
jgi:hypothetical protein